MGAGPRSETPPATTVTVACREGTTDSDVPTETTMRKSIRDVFREAVKEALADRSRFGRHRQEGGSRHPGLEPSSLSRSSVATRRGTGSKTPHEPRGG